MQFHNVNFLSETETAVLDYKFIQKLEVECYSGGLEGNSVQTMFAELPLKGVSAWTFSACYTGSNETHTELMQFEGRFQRNVDAKQIKNKFCSKAFPIVIRKE